MCICKTSWSENELFKKRSVIFGIKLKLIIIFLWCLCRCLVHYLPLLTPIYFILFFYENLSSSRSLSPSINIPAAASTKKTTTKRSPFESRRHKVSLFPFYRSAPHRCDAGGGFVQLETETLSRENRIGDAQKAKSQWLAVIIAKKRSDRLRSRRQIAGGQHEVV